MEVEDDGPRFSRLVSIHPDLQLQQAAAFQSQPQPLSQQPQDSSSGRPLSAAQASSLVQNSHPNGRMKFLSQVMGMHLKPRVEELLEEEEEEEEEAPLGDVKEDEEEEEHQEVVKQVLSPGSAINDYLNRIGNKYR